MNEALQIKEIIEIDIKNMGDDLIGKVRRLGELNDQYKRTEDLRCYGAIRNQKEEILVVEAKMSKAKDYLVSVNEILDRSYKDFRQQEELERDIPIPVQYC
ncbi:hypothetical protein [Metaclostridioides mangenotii]|uniref:hypothetical protein n=1 Tax=Metaclostridioides mangenotii TaxID=1540 RepID=UPI0004663290|nr:hypothetical protein [Clostridioides mangenotii]